MSSGYKQLLLFDCDGGRASLFDNKTILNQLPSNCHCYLFWNNNDECLTNKLKWLENQSRIHCCPTILKNQKNATDGKLIYYLGKHVNDYSFITIIHGGDKIYEEVIKTVVEDYGQEKITDKITCTPNCEELMKLFITIQNRNQKHHYKDSTSPNELTKYLTEEEILNISDNSCLMCSKKCKEIIHSYQHFKDKHKLEVKMICACKLEFKQMNEFTYHQKIKQKYIANNQGVVTCLATNESAKVYLRPHSLMLVMKPGNTNMCPYHQCYYQKFGPTALLEHLNTKHYRDIDMRIICCDNINERTLNEFYSHIKSQHIIIDIKKSVN